MKDIKENINDNLRKTKGKVKFTNITPSAFVVGSPKGDLGHLGDLLPQIGLLKVTFLFKSLLSERKDDGGVLHTLFAMHRLSYIIYDMIPYLFNNH